MLVTETVTGGAVDRWPTVAFIIEVMARMGFVVGEGVVGVREGCPCCCC